jgi:hypothetical protein
METFKIQNTLFYKRDAKDSKFNYLKIYEPASDIFCLVKIPHFTYNKNNEFNSNIYKIISIYKSTDKSKPVITDDTTNSIGVELDLIGGFYYTSGIFYRKDIYAISTSLEYLKEKVNTLLHFE